MSQPAHTTGSQSATSELEIGFRHVLLIEDDEAHSALIRRALGTTVQDVTVVPSGKEALALVNTPDIDLVLCDLHLQDCSGIEVLRPLQHQRADLPIIVLTSSSNVDDAVAAMREGAWDFMVKQFSGGFADRLRFVLSRSWLRVQQERREIVLRAERNAFWVAAQTAQDGLAFVEPDGRVLFSNQAFNLFLRKLGSSRAAMQQLSLFEIIAAHDYSVADGVREALKQGGDDILWSATLAVTPPKGEDEVKHYEMTLSVIVPGEIEGKGGALTRRSFVVWVRDITLRKEQEQFQRDLLATTTHDLKGPLGAVLTCSELLSDSKNLAEKDLELVTRIGSCARNSISIIDEFLSARRIQDGVMVVRPEWQDLDEILEDIVLDYQPVARAKAIDFSYTVDDPEQRIYADRIGLMRVIGNLVSNALKFTPKDGIVKVGAEAIDGAIRISVTDTGSGIESSARHHLFERYGRLDKHQAVEGTGLGLFVVKSIVEAHSGKVEVRSEAGKGSTFVVTLPNKNEETARQGFIPVPPTTGEQGQS